jgi:DNA-binding transcriptional LysR family regulator
LQIKTDLNDLRLVHAIQHCGSLAGAARRLGVNHATVFRRLNQLELQLGVRLFEREGGRYQPTAAGEAVALAGAAMQETAHQALLQVAGQDLRPQGDVRLSTTDTLALSVLPGVLAACRAQFPAITLSVLVDNRAANLSRRDADIALRPTTRPPEHLVGKQLASLAFCAYGSHGYLQSSNNLADADHAWMALDDNFTGHRSLVWLEHFKPLAEVGYRSSSFGVLTHACASGLGLAVLPCLLGDAHPQLRRHGMPISACTTPLWLLVHPDLRRTARVQAVFRCLQEVLPAALPASVTSDEH